ncbi:hypothetical protein [Mucilaginibacter sp. 3215]|uniref:hypothetical protein n=1 Tax=Mucilaginibacter sp. 3215 TaxID=3373912 RepID=UPI003D263BFA
MNGRSVLLTQIEEQKLFIAKARKLFVSDMLKYDDYSEIKKEHSTSSEYLKKELNTVTNKLKSIDEQLLLGDRSISNIFQGFSNLDIADKSILLIRFRHPTLISVQAISL